MLLIGVSNAFLVLRIMYLIMHVKDPKVVHMGHCVPVAGVCQSMLNGDVNVLLPYLHDCSHMGDEGKTGERSTFEESFFCFGQWWNGDRQEGSVS